MRFPDAEVQMIKGLKQTSPSFSHNTSKVILPGAGSGFVVASRLSNSQKLEGTILGAGGAVVGQVIQNTQDKAANLNNNEPDFGSNFKFSSKNAFDYEREQHDHQNDNAGNE